MNKLSNAAIAAAMIASCSLFAGPSAFADPGGEAPTTGKATTTTNPPAGHKKVDAKKATKAKTEDTGARRQRATKRPIEQPDDAAAKAKAAVVEPKVQTEAQRRALEKPRSREEADDDSARRAGEAVGQATTTAATFVVGATQDVSRAMDGPGQYVPFAITWNPLGMIIGGRVSINIEYTPITHHTLIVNPHVASPSQDVAVGTGDLHTNRYTGGGGEFGYRYYSGHRGPNGLFVGSSFIGGIYSADLPTQTLLFSNIGIAADAGFQEIVMDHLALGAGLGVEYLRVSRDFGSIDTGPWTIATSGIKPRLLAQAGYAF